MRSFYCRIIGIAAVAAIGNACPGGRTPAPPDDALAGTDGLQDDGIPAGGSDASQPPDKPACVAKKAEVCNGLDDDCDGIIDAPFDLACAPCGTGTCIVAQVTGGAWRRGVARNLVVGKDKGIALPPLPKHQDYVWVANSGEDTVSKVRAKDGVEVGRFSVGDNPSRTAVDGNGDAWVAMRGDISDAGELDNVVKISGACVPKAAPPTATRECILLDIPEVGQTLRGVAIDAMGDAWIGSFHTEEIVLLDGVTGLEKTRVKLKPESNPYGLAIDQDGYVWISAITGKANVLRVDPVKGEVDLAFETGSQNGHSPYGIAVDGDGGVWYGTNSGAVFRVDANQGVLGPTWSVDATTRGVTVDDAGRLWTADSSGDRVVAIDPKTGDTVFMVPVGKGPVGVAVDHDGFIWSANQAGNSVSKVDPASGLALGTFPVGDGPYTYSDMTGSAFRVFKHMKGRWTGAFDSGHDSPTWASVRWIGAIPPPSTITFAARAAPTENELASAPWTKPQIASAATPLGVKGRWLELEVVLETGDPAARPNVERLEFVVEP